MHLSPATNLLVAVTGQFFHRQQVPSWFLRFVNSNVLFTGIPTLAVVGLLVGLRIISRRAEGAPSRWTDFDFGLQLVIAAIIAVPAATTLRVSKETFDFGGTTPQSTIKISAAILVALVILAVVLARTAGARRALGPVESPTSTDLAFGVFVPNLAGIFAVMLVLLFASRGGSVHG